MPPENMVFYEVEHSVDTNHFLFERNTDHSFPLHMHRCYEMVLMQEGEMSMQIDEETYTLTEGDLILVKPNRLHSYKTEEGKHSTSLLCVFSGDLIASINETITKYRLRAMVIHDVPRLYRDVFAHLQTDTDIPTIKGGLYLLCGLFSRLVDDTEEDSFAENSSLIRDMLLFIENHMDTPCTLHELAREVRYSEAYLSRVFMQSVGIPYSEYVRSIKINYACFLLKNTVDSVYTISKKCGYATLSTFSRSFKHITGISPQEYRLRTME